MIKSDNADGLPPGKVLTKFLLLETTSVRLSSPRRNCVGQRRSRENSTADIHKLMPTRHPLINQSAKQPPQELEDTDDMHMMDGVCLRDGKVHSQRRRQKALPTHQKLSVKSRSPPAVKKSQQPGTPANLAAGTSSVQATILIHTGIGLPQTLSTTIHTAACRSLLRAHQKSRTNQSINQSSTPAAPAFLLLLHAGGPMRHSMKSSFPPACLPRSRGP